MTKEIIVTVRSTQKTMEDENVIEAIYPGNYYLKNDKIYVKYEEKIEENGKKVSSLIKIGQDVVDIIKTGGVNTTMHFELDKKMTTNYESPVGTLYIGIETRDMHISIDTDQIDVKLKYALEINGGTVSDNCVEINIVSRKDSAISLC